MDRDKLDRQVGAFLDRMDEITHGEFRGRKIGSRPDIWKEGVTAGDFYVPPKSHQPRRPLFRWRNSKGRIRIVPFLIIGFLLFICIYLYMCFFM